MNNSVLNDIREKALQKENEIMNNANSSEEDKKYIADIVEFLKYEESFKKVPRSTVFSIFRFLGIRKDKHEMAYYNSLYNQILEDIDRVYTMIDESQITR